MNNQSLILLAIGLFMGLIVTVAAIDEYLTDRHPPSEVSGLIWRMENAFSRITDLEAVLEVSKSHAPTDPIQLVIRYLKNPIPALSARYVRPESMRDERFVVYNDQLSHYLPQDNLVIIKRWVGLPLAAVGLAQLDLSALKRDWSLGRVTISIVQDVPGFTRNLFETPLAPDVSFCLIDSGTDMLKTSLGTAAWPFTFTFQSEGSRPAPSYWISDQPIATLSATASIAGSYILEIRDAKSGELTRMIWVDRETFLIRRIVVFEAGQRASTLLVERMDLDQGLTADDILTIPTRGVETIRS